MDFVLAICASVLVGMAICASVLVGMAIIAIIDLALEQQDDHTPKGGSSAA